MKWERWHGFAAIGVVGVIAAIALTRGGDKSPSSDATEDAGADPAPKAPVDLLAELYVGSPNATWTKLQRGIGGAVGILPATMPGLVVALSDLDVTLSGELDGTSPIYGALAGDPTDPEWALALKLTDGRHARGLLVDGDTARFDGKQAAGMTILVPKQVASVGEEGHQVAITSNGWLLVMRRRTQDFPALGNYVTRTLAARPAPTENASAIIDVPRSALMTQIAPKLNMLWAQAKTYLKTEDDRMRAERGHAPDFGDPVAIIAALDTLVTRRLTIANDLDRVHVTVDVTTDSASLTATLSPAKDDGAAHEWIDGMRTGDAAAVLALPSASVLAVSIRDDAQTRTDQGKSLGAAMTSALGPRLKDPAPLNAVIDAATTARDELAGVAWTSEEPTGVLFRVPVRDADAANKAMNGAIELAKGDPFKDILRLQTVTVASEDVGGLGKVSSAMFVRAPDPKATKPAKPNGLAWTVADNVLYAAAGREPTVTLKVGAQPAKKLADEPVLSGFITAIGADASTIAIVQPLKLDPRRAALPTMPATLAVGKHGRDAFVRIDIPDALIREATRAQLGF